MCADLTYLTLVGLVTVCASLCGGAGTGGEVKLRPFDPDRGMQQPASRVRTPGRGLDTGSGQSPGAALTATGTGSSVRSGTGTADSQPEGSQAGAGGGSMASGQNQHAAPQPRPREQRPSSAPPRTGRSAVTSRVTFSHRSRLHLVAPSRGHADGPTMHKAACGGSAHAAASWLASGKHT